MVWTGAPAILDLVHDSIIVRSLDGTILQWNAAAEAQHGWSRAEALGRSFAELLPANPPELLGQLEAQLLEGGTWSGELARRNREGRELRMDLRWSVRDDGAGSPRQIVETGRDVTEQRANEEAIRLSDYRFRNLFDAMAVSFWEIDFNAVGAILLPLRDQGLPDLRAYLVERTDIIREMMRATRVIDVNAKTLEMFAVGSKEDIVGLGTERYWPAENLPVFVDSLIATLERKPHFIRETVLLDHNIKRLNVQFTATWSAETRRRGIVTLGIVNITDQLTAERKLQQIQADYRHAARVATLGEMTASIAHEVNQPLAAIVTNGEASLRWLDRAEPDVDEARQLAKRMVADARRAADVITRIRGLATRQSAGRERLFLNDVIRETLDFLRRDLQASDVRVEFVDAPDLPEIEADRTQLQQVLINLTINAKQAMLQHKSDDRIIRIHTSFDTYYVAVELEDSGPGISDDLATKVFDSFITTKASGLGIGLSICRTIIEAHGGTIVVVPTKNGARFNFSLPRVPAPELTTSR